MKIIFNKYGGLKTIEDRQLLVQSSSNANYVDIYYQDENGNFADETVNLATIAFKRADSFEIMEKTCDAVREELTNKLLYFRYVFQEDDLAVNGELQITVRLKQVVFDPEDETQILLIKQRAMGKLVAHIYEAIGTDYEHYNVIDGRLLQLELWQSTFDGTYYDVTQIDAIVAQEALNRNNAINDHNNNANAHASIRQEITALDNDLQEQIDGIDGTLQNHESRIGELEQFAENLETNITEEIEDALDNKADLIDGKVPLEQLPDVEDVLTGDITSHNHATEIGNHDTSGTAHTNIRNAVAEAKAIAEGKSRAIVFATEANLDGWLATPPTFTRPDGKTKADLKIGDNLYIEELDKPDYWWNGTNKVKLETEKVDLTDYAKSDDLATVATTGSYNDLTNTPTIPTIPNISITNGNAESGKYISQVAVDATDKHKLVITKADLPQGFSGKFGDLTEVPDEFTPSEHNHDDRYYTESEVDTKLGGKANTTHNHTKSDITDFPIIPTIPDITVNNGNAESGKYISQIAVDATDKHKLNITKENLPTLRPTIELEVASLTTLTEAEKLAIKNTLSSLIVDDKIDGTKFDDIVLVTTNDLIRLHYSSIDYYVANPQITVIFETDITKYILHVPIVEYGYSTLTSTSTDIPDISTSITADATSDAKTASPKAVKTYVDNAISTALDNLLGGEY